MTGNLCSTPKIPSSEALCINFPNDPESRFFVFFQKLTELVVVDKFVEWEICSQPVGKIAARANGELLACQPATELPLAQRYFLY